MRPSLRGDTGILRLFSEMHSVREMIFASRGSLIYAPDAIQAHRREAANLAFTVLLIILVGSV